MTEGDRPTYRVKDDGAAEKQTYASVERWWHRIGCPCGCLPPDDPCITERPVRSGSGCCCGVLDFDALATATRRGINCARGCVAARLREAI